MGELKLICQHLDRIIENYFITQDEFFQKQAQLETVMKEGMLGMAKARYSMGAKAVSPLQFNTDKMKAQRKVVLDPQNPIIDIDDPYMCMKMVEVDPDAEVSEDQSSETANLDEDSQGLRRRNVTEKEQKDTDDDKVEEITSRVEELGIKKEKSSPKKHDPLKWFGVLVPQALRGAQTQFKLAADLSCEVASLKTKLVHIQETIKRLLRRKEDIIESIDNSGFVIYDDSSFLSSSVFDTSQSPNVTLTT